MNSLDKFYTSASVADDFISFISSIVSLNCKDVLEPSAGSGILAERLKRIGSRVLAIDIEPDRENIIKQDFLTLTPEEIDIVVGNPPFGKNSSLAVKFFNVCADWSPEHICFILPNTFNKPRFWGRLDKRYSLIAKKQCPKNAFTFNGKSYDVPCVMQIWKKAARDLSLPNKLEVFEEACPYADNIVFVRRVGGKAGCIVPTYTRSSTYCLSGNDRAVSLLKKYEQQFNKFSNNTAGVRSITLLEMEDIIFGRYANENIDY